MLNTLVVVLTTVKCISWQNKHLPLAHFLVISFSPCILISTCIEVKSGRDPERCAVRNLEPAHHLKSPFGLPPHRQAELFQQTHNYIRKPYKCNAIYVYVIIASGWIRINGFISRLMKHLSSYTSAGLCLSISVVIHNN